MYSYYVIIMYRRIRIKYAIYDEIHLIDLDVYELSLKTFSIRFINRRITKNKILQNKKDYTFTTVNNVIYKSCFFIFFYSNVI